MGILKLENTIIIIIIYLVELGPWFFLFILSYFINNKLFCSLLFSELSSIY